MCVCVVVVVVVVVVCVYSSQCCAVVIAGGRGLTILLYTAYLTRFHNLTCLVHAVLPVGAVQAYFVTMPTQKPAFILHTKIKVLDTATRRTQELCER